MGMRKALVTLVVLVVVALLAGAMHVLDRRASRAEPEEATGPGNAVSKASTDQPPSPARAAAADSASVARVPVASRARPEARAERDALRQRILEAMHARERAAANDDRAPPEDAPPSAAKIPHDAPGQVGTVVDRTGTHADHVKVVNEDLIPLTDECYALARETSPELRGMLVLDFEIIGDEDIGGIIESVRLGEGNELSDPGLVECVQESILSTTLPPPSQGAGGRDEISLSLKLSPDDEDDDEE